MNAIIITFMIISGTNAFIESMRFTRLSSRTEKQSMRAILGSKEDIFNVIEPMSNDIAHNFKLENEYKCRYISTTELDIYVNIGFMKAVEQFSPTDEPSVFSVFASYCIYNELNKGIKLVQEIQSQSYIDEWEIHQQSIQKTTLTQHNYIQESSGELKNENDTISLITYLVLWEYINKLPHILKRVFIRKFSEFEFHPKHMHTGCVVVKRLGI